MTTSSGQTGYFTSGLPSSFTNRALAVPHGFSRTVSVVAPAAVDLGSGFLGSILVFLREFIGGLVFGTLAARLAMLLLPRLGESDAAIASVTLALAYVCFVVADQYLHISGVVSVVIAALTVAAYGPTHLHPRRWTALRQVWAQLEFWANCLIFVLASMVAANVVVIAAGICSAYSLAASRHDSMIGTPTTHVSFQPRYLVKVLGKREDAK